MNLPLRTATAMAELAIVTNNYELRRDLHIFIDYIRNGDVKRAHRTNELSKTDTRRLAKMMGYPGLLAAVKANGSSPWLDFIDQLALTLGFVKYDTEGEYMGYTSMQPSFPDNYIEFKEKAYEQFMRCSQLEQEQLILNALIDRYDYNDNEFYGAIGPLCILDGFSTRGCAIGVMPTIKFNDVRRFLLNILKGCRSGVWYTTESLVRYLKDKHTFFLIPKEPEVDRRFDEANRYGNFVESKKRFGSDKQIPDNASDAFERVEGRYIERFLESIPLSMRYLDVAYDSNYKRKTFPLRYDESMLFTTNNDAKQKIYPSRNILKAFRVNERFLHVMNRCIREPKVTIQPNFELYVDSELYPVNLISNLTQFSEVVTNDVTVVLRLSKKKVLEKLTKNKALDVVAILTELTGRELPQNIVTELREWRTHSDVFTLFDGFGLLEYDKNSKPPDGFMVENISSNCMIIREPDKLFSSLEKKELVPLMVKHSDGSLHQLSEQVLTSFPKKSRQSKKPKETLTLKRQALITLNFPSTTLLKTFSKELMSVSGSFTLNEPANSITYSKHIEPQVKQAFSKLKGKYNINIEDIE